MEVSWSNSSDHIIRCRTVKKKTYDEVLLTQNIKQEILIISKSSDVISQYCCILILCCKKNYNVLILINCQTSLVIQCTMAQALKKFGIKDFAKMMTSCPIFSNQNNFRWKYLDVISFAVFLSICMWVWVEKSILKQLNCKRISCNLNSLWKGLRGPKPKNTSNIWLNIWQQIWVILHHPNNVWT